MKNKMKLSRALLVAFATMLLLASCKEKEDPIDISLLPGKWVTGTEYWRYDTDGRGATWDTKDDVSEDEAQAFKWEYDEAERGLTVIHWSEMSQDWLVPKAYTIKSLSATDLQYEDRFGQTFSFSRVQ